MHVSSGALGKLASDETRLQRHGSWQRCWTFCVINRPSKEVHLIHSPAVSTHSCQRQIHGRATSPIGIRDGMVCMLPVFATLRCGRRKARVAIADCLDKIQSTTADSLDAAKCFQNIHITIAEGLGRDSADRFNDRQQDADGICQLLSDIEERLRREDIALPSATPRCIDAIQQRLRFLKRLDDLDLHAITSPNLLRNVTWQRLRGTSAMVSAEDWDSLLGAEDSLFLEHRFLSALEDAGCVSAQRFWQPRFLLAWDDRGQLIGAVPLYLKMHSDGEFCDEGEWIEVARGLSLDHWPRLFVGVPFTPHVGRRLIAAAWLGETKRKVVEGLLLRALVELSEQTQLSVNVAFSTAEEGERFDRAGFVKRGAWQAWWTNRRPHGYADVTDFLGTLKGKKARAIERQRDEVERVEGLRLEVIDGAAGDRTLLSAELMSEVYSCCYRSTQMRHSWFDMEEQLSQDDVNEALDLNERFFRMLAERFSDRLLLVLARRDGQLVGGSLSFSDGNCICGRYWGFPLEAERVRYLHFECCYHRLIEHAVARGCRRIEPGNAGGSIYKVQRDRGFEPVATPSYHFIPNRQLYDKIQRLAAANLELPSWASARKSAYS